MTPRAPLTPLRSLVNARPGEGLVMVLAFAYHFFVLAGYMAVRPVREAFGIERGAFDLPWLFTGTLLGTLALHPLYTLLVKRFPRRVFIPVVYHFFAVNLALFYFGLVRMPEDFGVHFRGHDYSGTALLGYGFFIWLSVFNLFVVSVFWSFMADSFREEQGRRLFGFIAAGGSLGALLGASIPWTMAEKLGSANMLLFSIVLLECAVVCVWLLGRVAKPKPADNPAAPARDLNAEVIGGGVLEGVKHVFGSSYLLAIAGVMLLMTICSTLLYMQQAEIVSAAFETREARTAFFAKIDVLTNIATFALQIFIVSRLMKGVGVACTLAILPVASMIGFALLAMNPSLAVLVAFQVVNRSGRYAIMRPAREVLYTALARTDKYKAKNFNDTFVYRFGDQVAAWADKGLRAPAVALSSQAIAWIGVPVAAAWAALAVYAGVRHARLTRGGSAAQGGDGERAARPV